MLLLCPHENESLFFCCCCTTHEAHGVMGATPASAQFSGEWLPNQSHLISALSPVNKRHHKATCQYPLQYFQSTFTKTFPTSLQLAAAP